MNRVIPWTLPPVKGGSIGGYTPQPMPDPVPTPDPVVTDPYDLSNIQTSFSARATSKVVGSNVAFKNFLIGAIGAMTISGVEILNNAEVGSVIAKVQASGTVTYISDTGTTLSGSYTITPEVYDVDISSIMTKNGGTADFNGITATQGSATITNILDGSKVYTTNRPSSVSSYLINTTTTNLTFELQSITVYNANGVALMEWVPE